MSKAERRAAREKVGAYHEEELELLLDRVGIAIDGLRAGEKDAYDVDEVIFQYSRAAKELWKFCNLSQPGSTARMIDLMNDDDNEDFLKEDWWERGRPRRR